jgi:hypothetical protein
MTDSEKLDYIIAQLSILTPKVVALWHALTPAHRHPPFPQPEETAPEYNSEHRE